MSTVVRQLQDCKWAGSAARPCVHTIHSTSQVPTWLPAVGPGQWLSGLGLHAAAMSDSLNSDLLLRPVVQKTATPVHHSSAGPVDAAAGLGAAQSVRRECLSCRWLSGCILEQPCTVRDSVSPGGRQWGLVDGALQACHLLLHHVQLLSCRPLGHLLQAQRITSARPAEWHAVQLLRHYPMGTSCRAAQNKLLRQMGTSGPRRSCGPLGHLLQVQHETVTRPAE